MLIVNFQSDRIMRSFQKFVCKQNKQLNQSSKFLTFPAIFIVPTVLYVVLLTILGKTSNFVSQKV